MIEELVFSKFSLPDSLAQMANKIDELIDAVNKLIEKEEEWKVGDTYWWIEKEGDVFPAAWDGDVVDRARAGFMGIYRTREQAEAVRDKIREFVKTL